MNADPLIADETQPTQTLAAAPSGSQTFFDSAASSDKTLKLYDGGFHDPLNDIDRVRVMSDITNWIGARLA